MRLAIPSLSQLWPRMRVRLARSRVVVGGAIAGLLLLAVAAFGPLVRARVASAAAARHLEVTVGSVRPSWFGVRLREVGIRLQGVPGVVVRLDDVRVGLSATVHVDRLDVRGGQITLSGKLEQLRDDLERWRSDRPSRSDASPSGLATPIAAEGISVQWADGTSAEPRLELSDLAVSRGADGAHVGLSTGRVRFGRASISLAEASADLDPKGMVSGARLKTLLVELLPRPPSQSASPPAAGDIAPASNPGPGNGVTGSPMVATRAQPGRARAATPSATTAPADPAAPFIAVPDLHIFRRGASTLASQVAARFSEGASVTVDALTWKIAQSGADRIALTFGPGPVSVTRTASAVELRYSTNAANAANAGSGASGPGATSRAGMPGTEPSRENDVPALSVRAVAPTDGSDVSLTLEGGPVSLSLLGIQEGAAGLVDVGRASVAGRARVVLAGDGGSLSFDADLATRGVSLNSSKLSSDLVRGLDLALRARGVAIAGGEIRLDDFAATVGSLRLTGSGVLDQEPDFVTAAFRFEIPTAKCQSLLASIPSALLPALRGTALDGTFGARGHFAFDSRTPDDLDLQYDIQDRCRMVDVAEELRPERFKQPFVHTIYLPDGTTSEELTGPTTSNWTGLQDISPYMQVAVLTTEDGAFPHHHGFNHWAIRASIVANLKARRFVRGASTITMQLAKNLFLSREKTLSRKLEELVLTDYLEQTFTKGEILELYLNVIEFGPSVYGITAAAEYYFGRTPAELNLAESLFLSSLLPAPLRYSAMRDGQQPGDGWMRNLRTLMQVAQKTGLVTEAELTEGQAESVLFWHGDSDERPPPRPPVHARPVGAGANEGEGEPVPPFDLPSDMP
jgi:hypothetical protein